MNFESREVLIQKSGENNHVMLSLLKFRVKNYFMQMKSFLMQYKQGLILFLALLVPTMAGLNYIFTRPFLIFVTAHHPVNALTSGLLIYFIFAIWILIQKEAFKSAPVDAYLATLPISNRLTKITDLLMLGVANNIFLIPLIVVIAKILFSNSFNLDYFLSIVFLAISIFSIQKNLLNKNYFFCLLVIMVSFFCCFAKPLLSDFFVPLLLMGCLLSVFYTFFFDFKLISFPQSRFLSNDTFSLSLRSALLLRTAKTQIVTRLSLMTVISAVGFILLFFSKLSLYSLSMTLVIQGVVTFLISGIFVSFKKEKKKHELFLNCLPLSRFSWAFKDILYAIIILIVFNLAFCVTVFCHFSIGAICLLAVAIYQIILLLLLYVIRMHFDVFGTVLSVMTLVAWISLFIVMKGIL